jgi:hypothetical protein
VGPGVNVTILSETLVVGVIVHARTMMHCPSDKGFKMISRHLPLMDMIHTKRYVKWTRENC